MFEIAIDESVRSLWLGEVFLAIIELETVAVDQCDGKQLESKIDSVLSEIRKAGRDILIEPIVSRMRTTFRSMPDMDPSRYRPASESLIRRCLDKGMFRISPLVDTNNILSLHLRLPIGIYNLDSVKNSVSVIYRIGFQNETYSTISGQVKSAEGKLVLADEKGVIGSPIADSARAAVQGKTDRALVVAYLPFETAKEEAEAITLEIESTFGSIFSPKALTRHLVV